MILGGKRMPGTEDGPGPLQARPSRQRYGGNRRPADAGSPTWRRRRARRATARRSATWPPPRSRTVAPPAPRFGPGGGHLLPDAARRGRSPARPPDVPGLLRIHRRRAVQRLCGRPAAPVHHLPAPPPGPPAGSASSPGGRRPSRWRPGAHHDALAVRGQDQQRG
jgi:hypothetical protein